MYEGLIKELRVHKCDATEEDTQEICEECQYSVFVPDSKSFTGIASVCVCGQMRRAADAIEELSKHVPSVPYGDLIDRDALEAVVEQHYKHHKISRYDRDLLLHYLDIEMAPTIITADGKDTDVPTREEEV